jgi:hypothetical protein
MSQKQNEAAILIARGLPLTEIAQALSIHVRTIQRWQLKEAFRADVRRFQVAINDQVGSIIPEGQLQPTASKLACLVDKAMRRVESILDSEDSRNADILKAALLIGRWSGLETDFNVAVACLRKYGLVLSQDAEGAWAIKEDEH